MTNVVPIKSEPAQTIYAYVLGTDLNGANVHVLDWHTKDEPGLCTVWSGDTEAAMREAASEWVRDGVPVLFQAPPVEIDGG